MTYAEVIAAWVKEWEPRLAKRFDKDRARRDSSYAENWLFVEATPEAEVDLDARLRESVG